MSLQTIVWKSIEGVTLPLAKNCVYKSNEGGHKVFDLFGLFWGGGGVLQNKSSVTSHIESILYFTTLYSWSLRDSIQK